MQVNSYLGIIGAGASGLMAAAAAAEQHMPCTLIEGRHRPGLKLLMCGNNRCNITTDMSVEAMLKAFGSPMQEWLAPALRAFTPHDLQKWFQDRQVPVASDPDGRVYPVSGKADDVLHAFTDALRRQDVPVIFQAPVQSIHHQGGAFICRTPQLELSFQKLIMATGGVSYPKTGSTGIGHKIASKLKHRVTPLRPGLVGFNLEHCWWADFDDVLFPEVLLRIKTDKNRDLKTCGPLLLTSWGVRGGAVHDAARLLSRLDLKTAPMEIDLMPQTPERVLERKLQSDSSQTVQQFLTPGMPFAAFIRSWVERQIGIDARMKVGSLSADQRTKLLRELKHFTIQPTSMRKLKEAMVTVGGISLDEVDPRTMESRKHRGLYFTGELLDIDGPTGGFNLQAAFSTARLAVQHISQNNHPTVAAPPPGKSSTNRHQRRPGKQRGKPHGKSRRRPNQAASRTQRNEQ